MEDQCFATHVAVKWKFKNWPTQIIMLIISTKILIIAGYQMIQLILKYAQVWFEVGQRGA